MEDRFNMIHSPGRLGLNVVFYFDQCISSDWKYCECFSSEPQVHYARA